MAFSRQGGHGDIERHIFLMTYTGTYDINTPLQYGGNPMAIVYIARNLLTGGEYIGATNGGLKSRLRGHRFAVNRGSNLRFHNALRKYGESNFSFCVLEKCDDLNSALEREIALIAERKPLYNLTKGGQGALGFKMPREVVERLVAQRRGKPGYWLGKKRPLETIEKIKAAKRKNPMRYWLGKKRDAATIEKISKTKTGVPRKQAPPHALAIFADNMRRAAKARRRPIRCLDDNLIFESAKDAANYYDFKTLSVSGVCNKNGKRKTLFGKRFQYMEQS